MDAHAHHGPRDESRSSASEHSRQGNHREARGKHGAHDRHEGHSVAMFRDKFWLSLALTIPVVLLSHDIQEWFGYSVPPIPGIEYVPAILGTVVLL